MEFVQDLKINLLVENKKCSNEYFFNNVKDKLYFVPKLLRLVMIVTLISSAFVPEPQNGDSLMLETLSLCFSHKLYQVARYKQKDYIKEPWETS